MASGSSMNQPAATFAGRILVAAASYNDAIVDILLSGVRQGIGLDERELASRVDVLRVPGSLEVPQALSLYAGNHSAMVGLGCVLRGETVHFDLVCRVCAEQLAALAAVTRIPVINGVLTCESEAQARSRAGERGVEFGRSASIMARLREDAPDR
ncbi:MAG: 6,7-dimethyl-8-ribityllumazine synthase [Betaproteobacteria bacterium]|nr:6,7-dimethyl-8-ribityllumazine synthase [Betaproteobacteria bacterium]